MKLLLLILLTGYLAIAVQSDQTVTQEEAEIVEELEHFLRSRCRVLRFVKKVACWFNMPACNPLVHAVNYCTRHQQDVKMLLLLLNKRRCGWIENTGRQLCHFPNPLCRVLKHLHYFCRRLHDPQTTAKCSTTAATTTSQATIQTTTPPPTTTTAAATTTTEVTTQTTRMTTTTAKKQACTAPNTCIIENCSPENLRPQFECPPSMNTCCNALGQ